MSNFEKATRENWSFKTSKGQINIIDLWKLNVSTLKDVADEMDKELEALGKSGRRRDTTKTVAQKLLEEKIALVDYITEVKEKEAADARNLQELRKADAEELELLTRREAEIKAGSVATMTIEQIAARKLEIANRTR